jgi:hypothetical protein
MHVVRRPVRPAGFLPRRSQHGQRIMEPLWSRAVATGGNRWQMECQQKPRNQAKTVAVDCDRLPEMFHGKEGVGGSSPPEGSAKVPQIGRFSVAGTCTSSSLQWLWSRLRSFHQQHPPHATGCVCHSRPIDRSSNGYTNAWRNGLIAAMYALPSRPFGFTSTAICAW